MILYVNIVNLNIYQFHMKINIYVLIKIIYHLLLHNVLNIHNKDLHIYVNYVKMDIILMMVIVNLNVQIINMLFYNKLIIQYYQVILMILIILKQLMFV